ncbi:MAG: 3D domain-containing protein [Bacteriovoracaceae bacterium]|jgi:3D (Asp-Asp-Asp) domain-containing protein|nr:3D domain-containing protein [Bacteriovoracaceae bacterium]
MKFIIIIVIVLVSCADTNNHPKDMSRIFVDTVEKKGKSDKLNIDNLYLKRKNDFIHISDLLPTTYYIPQESKISCKGTYLGKEYMGNEVSSILSFENSQVLAKVCTRFYKHLQMEGTAILDDRGDGKRTINYAKNNKYRFVSKCKYGEGVKKNLCLLPYHTIAADNKIHKIGDIIYIPKAKGLILADGTAHKGYFIVRDTGAAFNGVGSQRVDLFTGLDSDSNNIFLNRGFHHKNPLRAYKLNGKYESIVKEHLRKKFVEIY